MIRLLTALFLLTVPVLAADRPNIVFIFSDDHATQALSAYNHKLKLLETPNLDRIANQGMLFQRCLVTNSICGPSRAVIQTGKYSHLNGFRTNGDRFNGDQQTFLKLLQKAGYQTAVIGKWHLVTDPQGFDYWHILPGQGAYYNPPMIDNGKQVKHEGYTSDIIGDLSLKWLEGRDKTKPFMLMCQHKAPHRAWEPAPRHLGFDNDRPPPRFRGRSAAAQARQRARNLRGRFQAHWVWPGVGAPAKTWRRHRAGVGSGVGVR